MLRYRCPQCTQLLQAHELRAGKKGVCVACLNTHPIPIDRSLWLTERGEPLFPRAAVQTQPIAQTANPSIVGHPPIPHLEPVSVPVTSSLASVPELLISTSNSAYSEVSSNHAINESRQAPASQPQLKIESPAAVSTLDRADESEPVLNSVGAPIHVQTQEQIAAALTEVLSHRMKPPRNPRRDLRLSTAGWLVLTGIGVALLLGSLFTSSDYTNTIIALGIVEIVIGYGWIVWLTSHRDISRGLVCLLPPVALYYLGQWKYAKFRPLRFVVSGTLLAALALLSPLVSPTTRSWSASNNHNSNGHAVDPEQLSNLERIRLYKRDKNYEKLIELLRDLTKTDALKSVDAKDRPELAIELKDLCHHQDTSVKIAAMAAYARWGGDDARDVCLKAIESPSQDERLEAVKLLPQWKNSEGVGEVARAVASLIGRPGVESNRAEAALVEIGGVAAERAALQILLASDELSIRLVVLSILEKVGGNESITHLRQYANTRVDPVIKSRTLEAIDTIQDRLKKDKKS
jgi:hypothetical protein